MRSELKELKDAIMKQPIQVNNSISVDGREFAKGTAKYNRDAINNLNYQENSFRGIK